jgi:hypothetical protein
MKKQLITFTALFIVILLTLSASSQKPTLEELEDHEVHYLDIKKAIDPDYDENLPIKTIHDDIRYNFENLKTEQVRQLIEENTKEYTNYFIYPPRIQRLVEAISESDNPQLMNKLYEALRGQENTELRKKFMNSLTHNKLDQERVKKTVEALWNSVPDDVSYTFYLKDEKQNYRQELLDYFFKKSAGEYGFKNSREILNSLLTTTYERKIKISDEAFQYGEEIEYKINENDETISLTFTKGKTFGGEKLTFDPKNIPEDAELLVSTNKNFHPLGGEQDKEDIRINLIMNGGKRVISYNLEGVLIKLGEGKKPHQLMDLNKNSKGLLVFNDNQENNKPQHIAIGNYFDPFYRDENNNILSKSTSIGARSWNGASFKKNSELFTTSHTSQDSKLVDINGNHFSATSLEEESIGRTSIIGGELTLIKKEETKPSFIFTSSINQKIEIIDTKPNPTQQEIEPSIPGRNIRITQSNEPQIHADLTQLPPEGSITFRLPENQESYADLKIRTPKSSQDLIPEGLVIEGNIDTVNVNNNEINTQTNIKPESSTSTKSTGPNSQTTVRTNPPTQTKQYNSYTYTRRRFFRRR